MEHTNNKDSLPYQNYKNIEQLFNVFFPPEWDDEKKNNLYINLWALHPETKKQNSFFYNMDKKNAFFAKIRNFIKDYNLYWGMGYRDKEFVEKNSFKRGGEKNVVGIPSLWLEIDVKGDGHAEHNLPESKEEAKDFLETLIPDCPPSCIVDSGGGLYAFWFFREPWIFANQDEKAHAKRMENNLFKILKNKASAKGWKPDNVTDLARVLRIPDTFNLKIKDNPRMAKIVTINSELRYSVENLDQILSANLPEDTPHKKNRSVVNNRKKAKATEKPIEKQEENPPNFRKIINRCAFLKHTMDHRENLPEIDWYMMISIAARCKSGQEICHYLSNSYPDYDYEETQKKILHALKDTGPYLCQSIHKNTEGEFCEKCKFWPELSSPIQLGGTDALDDILELNEKHAAVMVGGKFCILNEEGDPALEREIITFSSQTDFQSFYSNKKTIVGFSRGGDPIYKSIGKVWLESPFRRQYKGVIFKPNYNSPEYYNLFKGFPYKGVEGDWSLFREFILNVICNDDQKLFDWVIAWIARILQDPGGERPGTSIALRGKMGVGKGTFAKYIGKIFGNHFIQVNSPHHLVGKFNSHLANALLVFCDEGFWAGNKEAEGVIKGMVTESTLMVEPKGKDAFSVNNFINLIIATNNNWVVPAGFEERRFCVIDVSDRCQQNHEYFKKISDQMENGGIEAMVYDLYRLNISEINLRQIPRTEALFEQILHTMSPFQSYWYSALESGRIGEIIGDLGKWENDEPAMVPVDDVWSDYVQYSQKIGHGYRLNKPNFGKELQKLFNHEVRKPQKVLRPYGDKRSVYVIPPLNKCREYFEEAVKMKIPWVEEEPEEAVKMKKQWVEKEPDVHEIFSIEK